jgi:REP element-mobilizing transposase RayT
MPNHVHLIILISGSFYVSAHHDAPIKPKKRQLLPKIIGYFKMNSAKEINQKNLLITEKFWHRNYYEHIIRNKIELEKYRNYIKNNPKNWFFKDK